MTVDKSVTDKLPLNHHLILINSRGDERLCILFTQANIILVGGSWRRGAAGIMREPRTWLNSMEAECICYAINEGCELSHFWDDEDMKLSYCVLDQDRYNADVEG